MVYNYPLNTSEEITLKIRWKVQTITGIRVTAFTLYWSVIFLVLVVVGSLVGRSDIPETMRSLFLWFSWVKSLQQLNPSDVACSWTNPKKLKLSMRQIEIHKTRTFLWIHNNFHKNCMKIAQFHNIIVFNWTLLDSVWSSVWK